MSDQQESRNFTTEVIEQAIQAWNIGNTDDFLHLLARGTVADLEITRSLVNTSESDATQRDFVVGKIDEAIRSKKNPKASTEFTVVTETTEKTRFQEFIDFFRDIIVILIIVLIVRSYLVSPFQISGSSMEEGYHDREFILVNKFSYADFFSLAKVGDPVRGDVVILRPHASNGKEYYIKRVVGVGGDTIKFDNGEVFIKREGAKDFVKLNEGYLSPINKGKTFLPIDVKESEFTVPAGEYFVMGDNRNNSSDSRSCFMSCSIGGTGHFAERKNIIGKVLLDFGYINIFREGGALATKEWKWTVAPRFLNTPKDALYPELQ